MAGYFMMPRTAAVKLMKLSGCANKVVNAGGLLARFEPIEVEYLGHVVRLEVGDWMIGDREFAQEVGVSRNTLSKALDELGPDGKGLLSWRPAVEHAASQTIYSFVEPEAWINPSDGRYQQPLSGGAKGLRILARGSEIDPRHRSRGSKSEPQEETRGSKTEAQAESRGSKSDPPDKGPKGPGKPQERKRGPKLATPSVRLEPPPGNGGSKSEPQNPPSGSKSEPQAESCGSIAVRHGHQRAHVDRELAAREPLHEKSKEDLNRKADRLALLEKPVSGVSMSPVKRTVLSMRVAKLFCTDGDASTLVPWDLGPQPDGVSLQLPYLAEAALPMILAATPAALVLPEADPEFWKPLIEYWSALKGLVVRTPALMGRAGIKMFDGRPWRASFRWLTQGKGGDAAYHVRSIAEGTYSPKGWKAYEGNGVAQILRDPEGWMRQWQATRAQQSAVAGETVQAAG